MNYPRQAPAITIHRARAIADIDRENPGLTRILLRAGLSPLLRDRAPRHPGHELIVGATNGAPGAFSPDISWRWLRDELETIARVNARVPAHAPGTFR